METDKIDELADKLRLLAIGDRMDGGKTKRRRLEFRTQSFDSPVRAYEIENEHGS